MPGKYSSETLARRAAGRVVLALSPEAAEQLRTLGAAHPGGMSGLVAALVQQRAHLAQANRNQRRGKVGNATS